MQEPCPATMSAAAKAGPDWGSMGRAERDAAYNNTAAVATAAALREARDRASAAVRSAFPALLDLPYGPAPRQRVDLFPGADAGAPCLVFIHGGYWQMNSKDSFACLGEGVRAHGWAAAFPGYSLAPDATLTDIVGEIRAALHWLGREGPRYGIAGPLVVSGWSAGGHLAAMTLDSPHVVAGMGISGVTDRPAARHLSGRKAAAVRRRDPRIVAAAPAAGGEAAGHRLRHGRVAGADGEQPAPACAPGGGPCSGPADTGAGPQPFRRARRASPQAGAIDAPVARFAAADLKPLASPARFKLTTPGLGILCSMSG